MMSLSLYAFIESQKCITLIAPRGLEGISHIQLGVQGHQANNQGLYTFGDEKSISYETYDWNYVTFIQTDKPIYKPGQTGR